MGVTDETLPLCLHGHGRSAGPRPWPGARESSEPFRSDPAKTRPARDRARALRSELGGAASVTRATHPPMLAPKGTAPGFAKSPITEIAFSARRHHHNRFPTPAPRRRATVMMPV
jgi:hypothetical protein